MQYSYLGNTDIRVSRLCLGTMTWGEQNTEAEAHNQLDYAIERGINFIDTAEIYPVPPQADTQGRTEAYIGSWLARRGRRDDLVLASKVSGPGEWVSYLRSGPQLTAAHIRKALVASLERLQTDYLDLYQIHWPARQTNFFGRRGYADDDQPSTPLAETLQALAEWVKQGKIRTIGLSNETPWGVMHCLRLAEQLGLPRVVSIQNPYNLLNRSFEIGLAEIAQREKVGLLAYSPLAFGVLTGKYLQGQRPANARLTLFERFQRYTGEQASRIVERYVQLARDHGLSPAQMALAFVTSQPFVTANIIGATSMAQLQENMASADLELPAAVLKGIEAIHRELPDPCP